MNAVVFHAHGGTDQLRYEAVPDPIPGPEEILIRVKACALNHLDIWVRQGIPAYKLSLPHISGSDVAGIVEAVGSGVAGIVPGQRVFVSPGLSCWRCDQCLAGRDNFCSSYGLVGAKIDGGYAELIKVPARNVIEIPGSLSFQQAAAFPLVSVTAMHMLVALGGLQPGEDVLIMGAGSGVGSAAVQLAKLFGARVVTTVGAQEKIAKAKELGADLVINHAQEPIAARIKDFTGGRGVDVVIEHIGPAVWNQCVQSLAKGGRLITCGATTGGEVSLDLRHVYSRQLTIRGSYMGTRAELVRAAQLMGQGKLRAVVDRVFPLQEARAAQDYLLSRRFFGKILLEIA
jgi:2-desacetyl-2-hydroxyethyl bacteriochlorophyllide A dehydrogenase